MEYLYKALDFLRNKKHIEAIVLAVITVIIIGALAGHHGSAGSASGTSSSTGDAAVSEKPFILDNSGSSTDSSSSDSEKSKSSSSYKKEEEGSDIHDLLTEYYKDYAAGDTDAIEKVASPVSDMEKSYIRFMAKLLDSYEIKEIYTKDGVTDGSKLVSVYVQMHFKGLKSAAPGLDFFYVETDDSGALHINNLYSSFNQTNKENDMDPSVVSAIASFEEQKDVVDLQTEVQKEYNEISLSDKDFDKFMSKTYPSKVKSWQTQYRKNAKAAAAKKAAEEKKAAAEKAKADSTKSSDSTDTSSTSSKTIYKTTTKTNLRKKASINSDIIKTLSKGTKVTKISTKGKWLKVSYKGKTGYIRKMYLKKVSSSSSSSDKSSSSSSSDKSKSTSASSGPTEGKKLVLKDTVNVRKKPSTSAKRINLAYKGDKILVIKNRDDGWTKIQYHHKKGYVKTEFLK
jgi:SH3-like domain-containing protein